MVPQICGDWLFQIGQQKLNKSQENSREAGRVQISLQEDDVSE